MTNPEMNELVQSVMVDIEPYLIPSGNAHAYVRQRIELACHIAEKSGMEEIMNDTMKALQKGVNHGR